MLQYEAMKGGLMETKTLKEWRIDRGITVSHVAKLLGKTPQSIRNKESNRNSKFTYAEIFFLCTKVYFIDLSQVKA